MTVEERDRRAEQAARRLAPGLADLWRQVHFKFDQAPEARALGVEYRQERRAFRDELPGDFKGYFLPYRKRCNDRDIAAGVCCVSLLQEYAEELTSNSKKPLTQWTRKDGSPVSLGYYVALVPVLAAFCCYYLKTWEEGKRNGTPYSWGLACVAKRIADVEEHARALIAVFDPSFDSVEDETSDQQARRQERAAKLEQARAVDSRLHEICRAMA